MMPKLSRNPALKRLQGHLALLLVYVGLGYLGIHFASLPPGNLTVIWLPSGIALVGLLRLGWPALPTIFLSSHLVNTPFLVLGSTLELVAKTALFSSVTAGIDALQPALAYLLYRRFLAHGGIHDEASFARFLLLVVLLPPLLTCWGLILNLFAGGYLGPVSGQTLLVQTANITLADALGIFIVIPLQESLSRTEQRAMLGREIGKRAVLLGMLSAAAVVIFTTHILPPYVLIPFLLAPAVAGGVPWASGGIALVSVVSIAATAAGLGPFARETAQISFYWLIGFLLSFGLPIQYAAIAIQARVRAQRALASREAELRRHGDHLETLVGERTKALKEQAETLAQVNLQLRSEVERRRRAEEELRPGFQESERSRRALLSVLEDQRAAEARLRESESRYRLLADNTLDVIWTMDLDLTFTYVNPAIVLLTGHTPEEWIGSRLPDHCDEERFAEMAEVIAEEMKKGIQGRGVILETVMRKMDGEPIWVEIHGKVIHDEAGRPVRLQGITRDISERKRWETRLEHLNRVLRTIRDVNQLIVHEQDPETLIREGCRLLVENRGYPSALIVLTDGDDRPVSWAMSGMAQESEDLTEMLEQGALPPCCVHVRRENGVLLVRDRESVCKGCPLAGPCSGGQSLCVDLASGGERLGFLAASAEPGLSVDDEEQGLFSEMAEDLAYGLRGIRMQEERRRAEEEQEKLRAQFLQAQKMESVGRLAGGVAHDYNNMLNVVIGYTEMAIEQVRPGDPLREDLEEILAAGKRSVEITRQLLAFARKQIIHPKVVDLNETVEGMLKMLRRLIGEDIDLSWQPGADLWPVKTDPSQIHQILANLCVNARDAIAGVGKVTIETGHNRFDEAYCAVHAGFVPGEFVLLAVSDDGKGMDDETLENIFEPFFTTKGVGRGTGLGMATVYGIVKQNSGFVNVYSEPERGTTIKIYLPRCAGEEDPGFHAQVAETPEGRGETVLLVDDEIPILKLGRKMLVELGYQVLKASSHSEALTLAEEHVGEIHLLITDVVMPGMNGRDLAGRLQTLYPRMQVLFMSGYTANVIAHRGVLDEGACFLQKPFSLEDLALKVREALEQERPCGS